MHIMVVYYIHHSALCSFHVIIYHGESSRLGEGIKLCNQLPTMGHLGCFQVTSTVLTTLHGLNHRKIRWSGIPRSMGVCPLPFFNLPNWSFPLPSSFIDNHIKCKWSKNPNKKAEMIRLDLIKWWGSTISYLLEIHFKYKDTKRLKIKNGKRYIC